MIRLLHTGDIHANKTRTEDIVKLINIYIKEVEEKEIDAVLICGDFWDCAVVNNTSFASIIAAMSKLISLVPVYMIYGTASHEINNSLEIFKELGAEVTADPKLWTFSKGNETIDILGIPEPRRGNFIAKTVEETNFLINEHLDKAFNIEHRNPLVVMYHGEVSGAFMDNGASVKSDTKLTKAMWSKANPIYIACSHIHCPQEVEKYVRYCGSPVPVTFGEIHKPSYTLVSIENGKAKLKVVELPFSQNRVVEVDFDTFSKLKDLNFKGNNVKVKLSLTTEQRKLFRIKDEAKRLKDITNADNLTITISTKKEVAIRSKEIIKTTSISEKLKIYSEVNNIELTDSILQKAKYIEDNMLIKYVYPTHSFELLSLSLRGAKGLTGREEIHIDFTKYQDGILALLGSNGSGKSTLLENMSPYPRLLTRSGALRSHFYLKDSYRVVTYRDENNKYYRFTIQLAAHTDNGLCKYLAETSADEGVTWVKVEGVNGNVDDYTDYVTSIMGSVEMYLRTAFFTKGKVKGVNDIANATNGERIALISELLGTDSLSDMHEMIKTELKRVSKELDKFENIEQKKEDCEKEIETKSVNEKRLSKELEEIESDIIKTENEISETKVSQEEFNKNYAKYGNAIQMKTECENDLVELKSHLEKLKSHKKQNDFYNLNQKQIEMYKEAYADFEPINKEMIEISSDLRNATSELLSASSEYSSTKEQYDIEQSKLDKTDSRIEEAKEDLFEIDDLCPTCGAKLSERKKKELAKSNEYILSEIEALKEFKESQKKIVSDFKKKCKSLNDKVVKLKEKEAALKSDYDNLDEKYQAARAYLDMNEMYKDYINYTPVSNLEEDIKKTSNEIKNAEELLETLSGVDFVDYGAKLEELEIIRKEKENDRLNRSMDLASLRTQIDQLSETLITMTEQMETVKELSKEFEEYSILEQAFSNGGIQALELEAAVPSIAELTNQILHESYGDKFTISFSTLKQGRDKIIDDFSIEVTNNETGWTTPIGLLSEGEKVWCIQALSYAMSLIRMQRTGFNFMVRFADESDGTLDSEARLKYINMLNSTHNAGNARLTIIVTHSQEVKDIVHQTIQL